MAAIASLNIDLKASTAKLVKGCAGHVSDSEGGREHRLSRE